MKFIGDLTGVRGGEMEEIGIEETIALGSAVAGPDEKMVVFGGSDVAEENWVIPGSGAAGQSEKRVVVGFALTKKKVKSFMQPKLLSLARKKGISFVQIDHSCPLSEQGPFDVILHKLTGQEWRQSLEGFQEEHPEVTVLDPPYAIQSVYNRQSMLQEVAALNLSNSYGKVGVPKQLVVTNDPFSIPMEVQKAGLTFPIVAKPLVIDGTAKSHELSLAFDLSSLSLLDPPLVLQEFISHGGVMFKVYIVGETIKVVRRKSLTNVGENDLCNKGVIRFPRVSCAAASADEANLEPGVAELPPKSLLESLAKELRRRLGLRLFNLDMIRKYGTKDQFYVIDINYFPGFGKMPGYEHIFTDFLLKLVPNSGDNSVSNGELNWGKPLPSRFDLVERAKEEREGGSGPDLQGLGLPSGTKSTNETLTRGPNLVRFNEGPSLRRRRRKEEEGILTEGTRLVSFISHSEAARELTARGAQISESPVLPISSDFTQRLDEMERNKLKKEL